MKRKRIIILCAIIVTIAGIITTLVMTRKNYKVPKSLLQEVSIGMTADQFLEVFGDAGQRFSDGPRSYFYDISFIEGGTISFTFFADDNTLIGFHGKATNRNQYPRKIKKSEDFLKQLRYGMTVEQVTNIVGDLGAGNGSHAHMYGVDFPDGRIVLVGFNRKDRLLEGVGIWEADGSYQDYELGK